MSLLLSILLLGLVAFSVGAWLGAPYLPTLPAQIETALDLLNLKSGQRVLDIGSGDGSFLLAAARRGIKGIGYEINPLLVVWSKIRTWRRRSLIQIHWANFWDIAWPRVDGIYVFLIRRYMARLDTKLIQEIKQPLFVASYSFKIPGRKEQKFKNGIFLYRYFN